MDLTTKSSRAVRRSRPSRRSFTSDELRNRWCIETGHVRCATPRRAVTRRSSARNPTSEVPTCVPVVRSLAPSWLDAAGRARATGCSPPPWRRSGLPTALRGRPRTHTGAASPRGEIGDASPAARQPPSAASSRRQLSTTPTTPAPCTRLDAFTTPSLRSRKRKVLSRNPSTCAARR